MDMNSMKES